MFYSLDVVSLFSDGLVVVMTSVVTIWFVILLVASNKLTHIMIKLLLMKNLPNEFEMLFERVIIVVICTDTSTKQCVLVYIII